MSSFSIPMWLVLLGSSWMVGCFTAFLGLAYLDCEHLKHARYDHNDDDDNFATASMLSTFFSSLIWSLATATAAHVVYERIISHLWTTMRPRLVAVNESEDGTSLLARVVKGSDENNNVDGYLLWQDDDDDDDKDDTTDNGSVDGIVSTATPQPAMALPVFVWGSFASFLVTCVWHDVSLPGGGEQAAAASNMIFGYYWMGMMGLLVTATAALVGYSCYYYSSNHHRNDCSDSDSQPLLLHFDQSTSQESAPHPMQNPFSATFSKPAIV